jgi:topoisomerase IA-like protein
VQLGGNVTHERLQLPAPPDVSALKVAQLREELTRRGLESSGLKKELAARLRLADDLRHLVPHKRASVPAGIKPSSLTLAQAERLLSLPLVLGAHPDQPGSEITLRNGPYGAYVALQPAADAAEADAAEVGEDAQPPRPLLCSLPRGVSLWDLTLQGATELLDQKMERGPGRGRGGRWRGHRGRGAGRGVGRARGARGKTSAAKAGRPARPLA